MTPLLLAVCLFAGNGCAKKGRPQGGPEDLIGPSVLATVPASGAVGVPRAAVIEVAFSEAVDRTKLLPNLFISPPLKGTPSVKWKKRTARITWEDSLRADITYRVTIGGKLTDRHNNPLEQAVTFAFSTGIAIDSARISGQVWTGLGGAGGLELFAYRLDTLADWDPASPEFVTQSGEQGHFDLPYLPRARFRLLAVGDRNHNLKPDPNEIVAIPTADIDLTTGAIHARTRLFTFVHDTSSFVISNCVQTDDGSILVGFSQPVDTAWSGPAPLIIADSITGEILAAKALEPVRPHLQIVPMVTGPLQAGRTYRVAKRTDTGGKADLFRSENGRDLAESAFFFTAHKIADTTGPAVAWTSFPTALTALSPTSPLEIGFEEPVDTTSVDALLQVFDSLGNAIDGMRSWADSRTLRFAPLAAWPESTTVLVAVDSAGLRDRHGNPAPSQTLTWTFTPLTRSQMGVLSCIVRLDDSLSFPVPCIVYAQALGTGLRLTRQVPKQVPFELELPAGPWRLSAFLDQNWDGRFSPGSLTPFRHSEPQVVLPDTLSVRARFTLEDVIIRF